MPKATAPNSSSAVRRCAAAFWLKVFFFAVDRAPAVAAAAKGFCLFFALRHSRVFRENTVANARRILGREPSAGEAKRFAADVVGNFFDFVYDVGRSVRSTRAQLLARVASVEGHEHYTAARASGRGAIVVTAHMGSFEAGIVALQEREKAVHVVFKRDTDEATFEKVRSRLREKLGVIEAPVDDGWPMWMRVRDALTRDEVVVLQADRCMPGQKGLRVPMFRGTIELPTGPARLALSTGSPIIPVFTTRNRDGSISLVVEPAIVPDDCAAVEDLTTRIGAAVAKQIAAHPTQWLTLHRAFVEDQHPTPTTESPAALPRVREPSEVPTIPA